MAFGQRGSSQRPSTPGAATVDELGLTLADITPELSRRFSLRSEQGAVITNVKPGSLGAAQGLRPGHVIIKVGDKTVSSAAEAAEAINSTSLADGLRLYVETERGSHFIFIKRSRR